MKTTLRLVLSLVFVLTCSIVLAQDNDRAYKAFYKKINKGFPTTKADARSGKQANNNPDCLDSLENSIKALETSLNELEEIIFAPRPEREPDDRPEKRIVYKPTSPQQKESQQKQEKQQKVQPSALPKPTPRLSIETKAPVKTNTSETVAKPQPAVVKAETSVPDTKTEVQTPPTPSTPPPTQQKTESKPQVRSVNVSVVSGVDIKQYNVVIATLSSRDRANRLKAIFFAESNEKSWIVKNDQNLYYFILGSFDTEDEAIDKRNRLVSNYTSKYSADELLKKYGIQFTDSWILIK